MEASEPIQSQVKPLEPPKGLDDPDIQLANIDSGIVWGKRQGLLTDLPEAVNDLIDPTDG